VSLAEVKIILGEVAVGDIHVRVHDNGTLVQFACALGNNEIVCGDRQQSHGCQESQSQNSTTQPSS
jgi:hypothetical protein